MRIEVRFALSYEALKMNGKLRERTTPLTISAMRRACSSLSITHGPAMRNRSPAPTRTLSIWKDRVKIYYRRDAEKRCWPSGHRVIKTRAVFDRPMARLPDHPIYLLPTFSGRKNISTSAASYCTFFFCPCSYEVPTNALNSGCGSSGFDLNSGWNWHPMKNG